MHCTGQFDTRRAIGCAKRWNPPILERKRSTRVPLFAGGPCSLIRPYAAMHASMRLGAAIENFFWWG